MLQCDKLVIVDFSVFVHKAIFSLKFNPNVPATYTALSMIISCLSRIALTPNSVIMIVRDGRRSWRKQLEAEYKGNRKEKREATGIDFDHWFAEFDKLAHLLNTRTNWLFAGPVEHIEADDLAAVACRYYKDVPEIILVTIDSDWEMLWTQHPNVKIFNISKKEWKEKPDDYNVYAELAKKVNKETSDNLITTVTNDEEYDKRLMCVDLTRLPEWIEKLCIQIFESIPEKNIFPELLPNPKRREPGEDKPPTLQDRFDNLYNDHSNYISYEDQVLTRLMKEAKEKDKKIELKLKAQRAKERAIKKEAKLKIQSKTKIKDMTNGKIHPVCV